ncbi:unnamed protein product [Victoria cruziana]
MSQVLVFLSFLLPFIPCSNGLTNICNFSSFSDKDTSLKREGSAVITRSGVLEVTSDDPKDNPVSGAAIYAHPITLYNSATRFAADFQSIFTFEIIPSKNNCSGDGIAFFMAPSNWTSTSDDQTFGGGGLGIFNNTGAVTSQIIAIEFDTFLNELINDTSSGHMGIDIESIKSRVTSNWELGKRETLKGAAAVGYNSTKGILSSFLSYRNDTFPLNTSLDINLSTILPERVVVGFSASVGTCLEVHRILTWSFSATVFTPATAPIPTPATAPSPTPYVTSNLPQRKRFERHKMAIILVACLVPIVVLSIVTVVRMRRKKRGKEEEEEEEETDDLADVTVNFETGPRKFRYSELVSATNDFSVGGKLGQGGFGGVYRGTLRDTNDMVAVKRYSKGSSQGKKEYMAEVNVISRLRHRNLVRLIGWCHERGELLLVYEYMEGGSLDLHLFSKKDCPVLTWAQRRKVVLGLASAVLYLHEEWEQCVIHRDIKLSNVMVDSEFNARLGDFGLARLTDHGFAPRTTIVAGTMGYLAPECVITGKASTHSDVYSFGVVLLEITSGRRAVHPIGEKEVRLVEWMWDLYGNGSLMEAVDDRLGFEFDQQEMERMIAVGLWCAHPDPGRRPTMKAVNRVLSLEAELPRLPQKMPMPFYGPPPVTDYSNSLTTGSSSRTTATSMTVSSMESAEAALLHFSA